MPDLTFDNNDEFKFEGFGGYDEEVTQRNTDEGEGITRSCMNLVFLLDTSGSMSFSGGQRINQLNTAMPIALSAARDTAAEKEVELFIRIISFNSRAAWVMGSTEKGVAIDDACNNWRDLSAAGSTDTAAAIRLACTAMRTKYMGTRNYHPVVILVTDGDSDSRPDTQNAIEELRNALSGGNPDKKDKVWRFAIGVEGYNEAELQDFAMLGTKEDDFGNELPNEPMVFKVDNVADLAKVLKNVTESSLHSAAAAGDTGTAGEAPIIPI